MITLTNKHGFTILELSVVISIIGIMLAFFTSFVGSNITQSNINLTKDRMSKIESAIQTYVNQHGHLPCPASRTATIESSTFGTAMNCTDGTDVLLQAPSGEITKIGIVPTRTLGLRDDDMYDAWGRRFSYLAVADLATSDELFKSDVTTMTTGVIQVKDKNGNQITQYPSSCPTTPASCPINAYILISHGKNGIGAYGRNGSLVSSCATYTLEVDNCSGFADFRSTGYNDGDIAANHFDDIVRWKSKDMVRMLPRRSDD